MRDCTDEIGQDPFAAQCTAALVEYNSMWHQKKIVPRRKNLVQAMTLAVRDFGETFNVQLYVYTSCSSRYTASCFMGESPRVKNMSTANRLNGSKTDKNSEFLGQENCLLPTRVTAKQTDLLRSVTPLSRHGDHALIS